MIWDKWGNLNQQERAHIIIDAHSRRTLNSKGLRPEEISYATGLTKKEAEGLEIRYDLNKE